MEYMSSSNESHVPSSLNDMIATIAKTFAVAHEKDSDEHLAQALVYNAGRLAWRMREQGVEVDQKTSVSDVVTDADRAAEQFVSTVLELVRPEDGVLGEEGTQRESSSGRTWVVDPVDGTYNFTSGSDYWCSAVALVEGAPEDPSKLVFGAVHRPAMGYTWFGGPGIATTRDGKRVAPLADAPASVVSLGTYIHPTFLAEAGPRDAWLKVSTIVATIRMLGSASVDLGGVADGSLGAWTQHSVAAWDWLPGRALVEGAGGVCQKVESGGKTWCVAGNSQTVSEIVSAFTA